MRRSPVLLVVILAFTLLTSSLGSEKTVWPVDTEGLERPVIKKRTLPPYPLHRLEDTPAGRVVSRIVVDESGAVSEASVESSPDPDLSDAATNAVRTWIYKPGVKDDRNVAVEMRIALNFEPPLNVGFDGVSEPELIHRVEPRFPNDARRRGQRGHVIMKAIIDPAGIVRQVGILKATDPSFVEPSVEAVKQWRYRPATKDGKPVPVHFTVVVSYGIDSPRPASLDNVLKKKKKKSSRSKDRIPNSEPVPRRAPPPPYVLDESGEVITGTVELQITVDKRGSVDEVNVVSSPDPELSYKTTAAVRKWKFDPARKDGRRTAAVVSRAFQFASPRVPDQDGVIGPDLKTRTGPDIPASSIREGKVVLQVIVDEEGRVRHATVEKSMDPETDRICLKTVREWTYYPGHYLGDPVVAWSTAVFNFER